MPASAWPALETSTAIRPPAIGTSRTELSEAPAPTMATIPFGTLTVPALEIVVPTKAAIESAVMLAFPISTEPRTFVKL